MSVRPVPADLAGRPCPYCHSELETGSEGTECDACGAFHHTECWRDAGGCSTFGCVNAPKDSQAGGTVAPEDGAWSKSLIGVVVAIGLILTAAGTLAIVAVLSGDSPVAEEGANTSVSSIETSTVVTTTAAPPKPQPTFDTSSAVAFIRSYYSLLNAGRFAKAWQALSEAERAEAGGYSAWKAGYSNTKSTRIEEVAGTEKEGNLTSVSFSIKGLSNCGGDPYEQTFSGFWTIDLGAPEVISASFEQVGGDLLPDSC